MKKITLTQGKVALIDDSDYERVSQVKWCAIRVAGGGFYAIRSVWENGKQRHSRMQNVILGIDAKIDHIDGDGLNNQRANLRPATDQQNMWNRRMLSNNKSGFVGVSKRNGYEKYCAMISRGGSRSKYIGMFNRPKLAALAYDVQVLKTRGEFGVTNVGLGLLW